MSSWNRYLDCLVRYEDLGFSLDYSRMSFGEDFFHAMAPACERAFSDMTKLEAGEIANPDEGRMVGHYWLRRPDLAPSELAAEIEADLANVKAFAAAVHQGEVATPAGQKFTRVLLVGIGGSALGPQLVTEALTGHDAALSISFFDNTDPDGFDKILAAIGSELATTLTVVISKSGGTKETRNGMLEAEAAYQRAGLDFPKYAAAVTGTGSQLDQHAQSQGWIKRFPMADWVGGRTSVMSVVGLVPAALQGVDLDAFLAGAAAMDAKTRTLPTQENAAMILALMWFYAGGGRGAKDMVVLPYKDRLVLFSKYLQQLVMESLGKEHDLDGKLVHQGIAVYGNKGSTDQHAYVQQLRDGVNNFFATFIEVREARSGESMEVDPGATSGDYLQGFLRGTRSALSGSGRENLTLSIPQVDAANLGLLIALFERAVSFYASLVNINAYHQPGVEAGKKAATQFLDLLGRVKGALRAEACPAETVAEALGAETEDVYHCLTHLAANGVAVRQAGAGPAEDSFSLA
ncbi:MAG: glucose-6-phosphate isomerase [Verrucomicrobiota bacterium]